MQPPTACSRRSLLRCRRLPPLIALALVALLILPHSIHAEQPARILAAQAIADTVWGLSEDGSTLSIAQHTGTQVRHAALSPDGAACAYWLLPAPGANPSDACHLQIVDLTSGESTTIAREPPPVGAIAWSPNGKALAWVSNGALHTLRLGDIPRELLDVQLYQLEPPVPDWGPQGSTLYLATHIDDQHGLWRIESETGSHRLLTPLCESGPHPMDVSRQGRLGAADAQMSRRRGDEASLLLRQRPAGRGVNEREGSALEG